MGQFEFFCQSSRVSGDISLAHGFSRGTPLRGFAAPEGPADDEYLSRLTALDSSACLSHG